MALQPRAGRGGRSLKRAAGATTEEIDHLVAVFDDLVSLLRERRGIQRQATGRFAALSVSELAETQAGVVRPARLGIMRGAFATWGAVTVDRLDGSSFEPARTPCPGPLHAAGRVYRDAPDRRSRSPLAFVWLNRYIQPKLR